MISKIKNDPLMIIRIVLGLSFIIHGVDKFIRYDAIVQMFGSMGLAAWVLVLVAIVEIVAGLGVLFNIKTKIAGSLIAVLMIGAIVMVKLKAGFLGGYELDVAYLAMALTLVMACHSKCKRIEEKEQS